MKPARIVAELAGQRHFNRVVVQDGDLLPVSRCEIRPGADGRDEMVLALEIPLDLVDLVQVRTGPKL